MAFTHGKDGAMLLNAINASGEVRGFSASWKMNLSDTTCLGDQGSRGTQGLTEGKISGEGFLNNAALVANKPLYNALSALAGVDNSLNITVLPAGQAIGNVAVFATTDMESFEIEAAVDDAVKLTFEGAADGTVDFGYQLHTTAAAETSSTNSTGVDNAALTSNGGAAMLHVTAITGTLPTATIKVQHSVDNVTYADLATFTALTTVTGSERKEVAVGTTVNRYTRAASTIGGTLPNYTYGVSFARR